MIVQHKLTQITVIGFDEFCPKTMSILCLESYYMKKNIKKNQMIYDIWKWKLKVSESQIKKILSKLTHVIKAYVKALCLKMKNTT